MERYALEGARASQQSSTGPPACTIRIQAVANEDRVDATCAIGVLGVPHRGRKIRRTIVLGTARGAVTRTQTIAFFPEPRCVYSGSQGPVTQFAQEAAGHAAAAPPLSAQHDSADDEKASEENAGGRGGETVVLQGAAPTGGRGGRPGRRSPAVVSLHRGRLLSAIAIMC